MSFRDNGDKERVQAATDLVRLIGEQVNLRPKGKEFAGLCPFHDDKTPSMQVSPQKQIYKCFSCGAGGDAFSFVMNYHKMSFVESLKYLAERAGVELTPWKPDGAGGQPIEGPSERKQIAAANERAVDFYRALLRHPEHGREARAYLERRGVSEQMIEAFGLGYAPDRWDGLVTMIREKGWDRHGFELASLIRPRKTGDGDFDFLRHRLIFPIFDAIGRPIAFGGRKLRDEDEPKYLNSPETTLFNKSATLYGLHAAKKPIIDTKTAVIVEGYTDVIACHQAGAANVVAALGTALTAEHVRELRRYCEQVIVVMDGDAAGQKAADRAVQVFLTGDLDVSIAVLPPGQDPDELLKAGGLDAWDEVLDRAVDALGFAFDRVQSRLAEADTVTGRQKVAEEFMDQLIRLGVTQTGGVRRAFVMERLARMLRMSGPAVEAALSARSPRSSRNPSHSAGSPAPAADRMSPDEAENSQNPGTGSVANGVSRHRLEAIGRCERLMVAALVRHGRLFSETLPDGRGVDEALAPAELAHPEHRRLYQRVYGTLADGRPLSLAGLLGDLAIDGEHGLIQLATTADAELDATLPEPDPDASADDFEMVRAQLIDAVAALTRFRRDYQTRQLKQRVIQNPADSANPAVLQQYLETLRTNPSPAKIPRV